jgi:hypothetical protein
MNEHYLLRADGRGGDIFWGRYGWTTSRMGAWHYVTKAAAESARADLDTDHDVAVLRIVGPSTRGAAA